ncbi:MAG: hypothetical protein BWK80_54705 [Desulfobacteraceae bacterium IS3]|nr:MAG: hypothetical protein BWK80_54705 [Desulfobacteraceae bacterium IS3]
MSDRPVIASYNNLILLQINFILHCRKVSQKIRAVRFIGFRQVSARIVFKNGEMKNLLDINKKYR